MGLNSTILILNDDIPDIDKDPVTWWQKVREAIVHNKTGPIPGARHTQLATTHHADDSSVLLVGGNTTEVLGFVPTSETTYGPLNSLLEDLKTDLKEF